MNDTTAWKNPFFFAFLSSLLLYLSSPGSLELGGCAWLALVPLLWACRNTTPRRAAVLGLATGFFYYTALLYWITIVLGTYGHLPWWLSAPALLLLALYMSLYTAFFAAGISWAGRSASVVWIAPLLWVSLDLIRSRLFTGFPWQDLAYSQYQTPLLLQTADLAGHYGVTFLIVLTNGLGVTALSLLTGKSKHQPPGANRRNVLAVALPAVLVLITAFSYSTWRYQQLKTSVNEADSMTVAVVQGNMPQDQKWVGSLQNKTVRKYLILSECAIAEQNPALLVWPETALPFFPLETPLFSKAVDLLVGRHQVNLLTGAPHREATGSPLKEDYYNSAFLLVPDNPAPSAANAFPGSPPSSFRIAGRYDKQHLVPFGEYVPLRDFLPIPAPLVESVGDFTPGRASGPVSCQKANIGVLICFESIFPELTRQQVLGGATLLVNITNDAWFGRSSAPWQHLSMAVFRAVEVRRSMARAANTGISGFIDPLGRLLKISPLFTESFLVERVPLLKQETFYSRHGHYFPELCLILLLCAAGFIRLRRKNATTENNTNRG